MSKKEKQPENAARLERFFQALERLGLDAAVLDHRDDQFYLSGYTGSDSVLVLAVKKRLAWLVTDSRYTEEAETTAPAAETVQWRNNFPAFVGDMLRKGRFRRIAHTPSSLTVGFFNPMRDAAAKAAEWRDAGPILADLRAVKSRGEIAAMAKALDCAQDAFTAARAHWRVGMTEVEIKNDLEWEMRKRGAEDAAFETIVACGPNASLPHAHSGSRKLQPGKMLLIDFGARLGRYNSDLTRTLWPGEPPKVWLKRYRAVLDAQRAGIAAIRPGVAGRVPDAAARKVFADAGIDAYFTHSLGHGVGLAVHEEPRLGQKTERLLAPGNVVTVEPGVYFPGSGGIRVEDMILIEESAPRVLSSLPRDEASIVL